jgi:hypothetical protein
MVGPRSSSLSPVEDRFEEEGWRIRKTGSPARLPKEDILTHVQS